MSETYRVPISRMKARLWLVEGEEREIVLFLPPDDGPASLLEDERRFFPALEDDRVMLVAQNAVAALWVPAPDPLPGLEDELPTVSRAICVTLPQGRTICGHIRFVSSGAQDRTADFLNDSSSWFAMHVNGAIAHIAKRHVLYVQEEKS